ncbi:MAG: HMA2 domain-containing protein [Sarcina sp.]
MNVKKIIISQLMKIKVSHSLPGRVRFKVSSLKMIPEEYKIYEKFIGESLKKLKGIESVETNILTGSILVTYDENLLYEKKLLAWVDKIKEIGIGNFELIEKYGESNLDFVIKTIEQQLDEAVKKL